MTYCKRPDFADVRMDYVKQVYTFFYAHNNKLYTFMDLHTKYHFIINFIQ